MEQVTIYHNPRCSKSREALALIQGLGIEPLVIDYIKTPLSADQLFALRKHFDLKDFVRTNEAAFKALNLSLDQESEVLDAMMLEPKLMQRPIVTYKGKAFIARPPEGVVKFIQEV